MNKLERLLKVEQKINREDLLYKTGGTKKDMVFAF